MSQELPDCDLEVRTDTSCTSPEEVLQSGVDALVPVSYTHLDVYKRQIFPRPGEVFPQRERLWQYGKVSRFAKGSPFGRAAERRDVYKRQEQNGLNALCFQGAAGLGAGVVELRGLTDDDGAGANDQHFCLLYTSP